MNYNRGDVVETIKSTGEKNYLIVGQSPNGDYIGLNIRGNGKTKYRIRPNMIVKKVWDAKDHPWLKEEGLVLKISQDANGFTVSARGFAEHGLTVSEAVGNFIILHSEELGIDLRKA